MCFRAGTYKIPTVNDIPIDFRVTLLKDAPNDKLPLSYSSKAIGEPPLFLGASVYHALKVCLLIQTSSHIFICLVCAKLLVSMFA